MFPFLVLSTTVVMLTVWGAGIYSGAMYLAAGLLSLGALATSFLTDHNRNYSLPSSLLCCITVTWLLLTALPLPEKLDTFTGRLRSDQNSLVRKELAAANNTGIVNPFNPRFALSRNRCGTLRIVLLVIAVFCAIGLSSCLTRPWKVRYLQFLVVHVSIVAVLGFIGQNVKLQGNTFWWFIEVSYDKPIACFVNRNLFAGFVILLSPAALVLCTGYYSRKKFVAGSVNLVCFILLTTAVVGSMSRGALISYVVSLLVVIFLTISLRHRRRGLIICGLACISLTVVGTMLSTPFEQRVRELKHSETDHSVQERLMVWRDSVKLWKNYPLLGTGANAFRSVFSQYKSLEAPRTFNYAVNTYVQLLVEAGLLGFLLFLTLLARYVLRLRVNFKRSLIRKEIIVCVIGAIVAAMVHATVDLAPYILLYSVVLASVAGLALGVEPNEAKVHGQNPRKIVSIPYRKRRPNCTTNGKTMRIHAIFCLLIVGAVFFIYGFTIDQLDKGRYIITASPQNLAKALVYSPTSWQTWYHLGRYGLFIQDPESNQFGERCMSHAAHYNPNDYRIWEQLIGVRKRLKDREGANRAYERMMQVIPPADLRRLEKANSGKRTKKSNNDQKHKAKP